MTKIQKKYEGNFFLEILEISQRLSCIHPDTQKKISFKIYNIDQNSNKTIHMQDFSLKNQIFAWPELYPFTIP